MAVDHRPAAFEQAAPQKPRRGATGWFHRAAALVYVFFCFELGVFLLVFPWLPDVWPNNYFADLGPGWRAAWNSPYLRGAISGLGIIDIAISFSELLRLRRFRGG